jgi:hypothetical protein
VFAVHAVDVVFPNADGKGDLASTASWNLNPIPDPTNRPEFNATLKGATLTASANIGFAGFKINVNNLSYPVILDMRNEATGANPGPRKVTLSGDLQNTSGNNITTIKGGEWSGTSVSTAWGCSADSYYIQGATMTLSGTLAGTYGGDGAWIDLSGGSVVTTVNARAQFNYGKNSSIQVRDGSRLIVTGTGGDAFRSDMSSGFNNGYVVSGEDSLIKKLSSASFAHIGVGGYAAYLRVEDHGEADFAGTFCVGNAVNSSNNVVSVTGGGTFKADSVHLGYQAGTWNNLFAVTNGGIAEVSNGFYLGGNAYNSFGNTLLVSNGVFRGKVPTIGFRPGSSNNLVRVAGRQSVYEATTNADSTTACIFSYEKNNRFELDDAVWTNNAAKVTYLNCTQTTLGQSVFELKNHAEFYTTNQFYMTGVNYSSVSNLLSIVSGSRLYSRGSVGVYSIGNVFSISNGTLETEGDFTVTARSNSNQMYGYSNNWVKVAGERPRISATNGTFAVQYASYLQFDYPASGYEAGVVPVKAKAFTVSSDSVLIANGLDARIKALKGSEIATLVETSDGVTVPAAVLAAANAVLPEKCEFRISADGKSLLMKIYKATGTVFVMK